MSRTSDGPSAAGRRAAPRALMGGALLTLLMATVALLMTSGSRSVDRPSPPPAPVRQDSPPTLSSGVSPAPPTSDAQRVVGAGAVGLIAPEELQAFMVATRTPDGRIVIEHGGTPSTRATPHRPVKARGAAARDRSRHPRRQRAP